MTYEIATRLLDRALDRSSRKEVLAYSEWFLAALPARVEMLPKEVAATRGYKSWRADSSVESLERLGRWFEPQEESTASPTEPSPPNAAVFELSVEQLEVLESGLSGRTLSLCLDIGMCFGRVLVKNVPGAAWKQEFGGVSNADYGHVVVWVKGLLSSNPFRLMTVVAYGVAAGARAEFSGVYEISMTNIVSRNRRKPTRGSRRRRQRPGLVHSTLHCGSARDSRTRSWFVNREHDLRDPVNVDDAVVQRLAYPPQPE